jgi:hypothetical protein
MLTLEPTRQHDSLFRKIYVFLLNHDPLMMIVNDVFKERYAASAKNGSKLIDDWIPIPLDYETIKARVRAQLNKDITAAELRQVIRGPVDNIKEYHRMKSNLTIFTTRTYEARHHSRCTRKMIKYKSNEHGKHAYATIERMIQLLSHSCTELANEYKLLIIHNWKRVDKKIGNKTIVDHPSCLPHVTKMSNADNLYNSNPVIQATVVYPYNVAAWPASGEASEAGNYLMVQQHVVTDETIIV